MLFEDIEDYPAGRVLTGSTGSARRLGHTLNLGDDLDDAALVAALRGKPSRLGGRRAGTIPTETVADSPLLANVVEGKDVDLLSLPVPRWHADDGGRYIGTGCLVITRDPETRTINGGCYRMEVVDDGRSATINAVPGKHGAQHTQRWFERGEKAPVIVSFGHHPVLLVTGGTEVPTGISELEYAGAILGERLPVLTGEHTGLPIPAGSEVVVEGWLRADHAARRGPVRRVDRVLLRQTASGARTRDRADVLPRRPDPARRATRQAAARLLLHADRHEVGDDRGRARRRGCAGRAWRVGARGGRRPAVRRGVDRERGTPGTRSRWGT